MSRFKTREIPGIVTIFCYKTIRISESHTSSSYPWTGTTTQNIGIIPGFVGHILVSGNPRSIMRPCRQVMKLIDGARPLPATGMVAPLVIINIGTLFVP